MDTPTKWYQKTGWIILLLIVFFPVGLYLMWKYTDWSPKTKWIITAILVYLFIGNLYNLRNRNSNLESPTPQPIQQVTTASPTSTSVPEPTMEVPEYEITNTLTDKRYDGGTNYYVLIDPVDLKSDSFKEDVKNIVRDIRKQKGNKISVDILDDSETMKLYFSSHYGENKLGRILNKEEVAEVARHLIAMYSGELETAAHLNELSFFPGAFKDTAEVGIYVENMEFNP